MTIRAVPVMSESMTEQTIHLHLVSDSTGETVHQYARAALAQFPKVQVSEHIWTLVRTPEHVQVLARSLERDKGVVLFSVVDQAIRKELEAVCRAQSIPHLSVLDPVVALLGSLFGAQEMNRPGAQHRMDKAYFERMAAVEFAVTHDDGLNMANLQGADMLLIGVSRTSKTPTSMYLANRGFRVANYALVPGVPFPIEHLNGLQIFVVGLASDPKRLTQIRRNRLAHLSDEGNDIYADLDQVTREMQEARRLFNANGWPVLDVTRRSVEETAAAIIHHYNIWREENHAS